jgi:transcriptional regulator with XRE-family HTH domain
MPLATGQNGESQAKQNTMPKTPRTESEERKKEILRLFQTENLPPPDIAERIGVTRQYVNLVLREAGEETEPVDVSAELAAIKQLAHYSSQDIALLLGHGINRAMVWRWESGKPARIEHARRIKLLARGLDHAGNLN